MEKVLQADVF